jgi:hypothetical protein
MATRNPTFEEVEKVAEIPSILTNSAIEMLQTFTTDIVEIKAESAIDETNPDSLMPEYGLRRKQTHRQSVTLAYKAITDNTTGEVENPMTEAAVDDIVREIGIRLDDMTVDAQPDLAVRKLVVEATLPELERQTRALSDEFELTFISDRAEDRGETNDPAAKTRMKNRDRRLYSDLSFDVQNLNLRSVVETRAKYTEQANGKIMGWGGPNDDRPDTDPAVTPAVRSVIPDEYEWVKEYGITESNELVLIGSHDGASEERD